MYINLFIIFSLNLCKLLTLIPDICNYVGAPSVRLPHLVPRKSDATPTTMHRAPAGHPWLVLRAVLTSLNLFDRITSLFPLNYI